MAKAILYDATKCTACRGCQVACKSWNELPAVSTTNRGTYENPPELSSQTWLKIEFNESAEGGKIRWLFNRQACMHCTDAGCVSVCPNGTLYHNEDGFVSYNPDTCTGCGYCADACPYGVPHLEGNSFMGVNRMYKCSACTSSGLDRTGNGEEPACVKTCPTGALAYGERSAMIAEGKSRVQLLKAAGKSNANLYGENELNGLHVLYVLEESPATYGLPENPQISPATAVWKGFLQPAGWVLGGLTIAGLGLNYIVARANANKEAKK
jgi:formate dehydrogenase iron-sulfur subunit